MEMKWISIALAALAAVVLGYVWHNVIFEDMGQEKDEHRIPQPLYMIAAYICTFVIALGLWKQVIGLHGFIAKLKESAGQAVSVSESGFLHGAFHGLTSSFFYGVVSVVVLTAFSNGKGLVWMLVNVSYWVAAFALMGGIVGAMG